MYPFHNYPLNNSTRNGQKQKTPIVEVEGVGKIKVMPTLVLLRMGVMTIDIDVQKAQDENASTTNKIINALIEIGIKREDIETVTYNIIPQYHYSDTEKILKGYEVTHLLSIKLDRIENAGVVYDVAFENGANLAENPVFKVENEETYQLEALKLAVENAKAKGAAIISSFGFTMIQKPVKIIEVSSNIRPQDTVMFEMAAAKASISTPIQARELEFQGRVEVHFTYN